MRFIFCAILAFLSSKTFAESADQGVFVKPKADLKGRPPEIVRMILGDNELTPVVDISPEGPTLLVFPGHGNVVRCVNTSEVIGIAEEKGESVQTKDQRWFTEVVFFVNSAPVTEENVGQIVSSRIAVICSYEIDGKTYRHQVKFKVNPSRRHAVVFFERQEDHAFDEYKAEKRLAVGKISYTKIRLPPRAADESPMPEDKAKENESQLRFTKVKLKPRPKEGTP